MGLAKTLPNMIADRRLPISHYAGEVAGATFVVPKNDATDRGLASFDLRRELKMFEAVRVQRDSILAKRADHLPRPAPYPEVARPLC